MTPEFIGYHLLLVLGLVLAHVFIKLLFCAATSAATGRRCSGVTWSLWLMIAGFCLGLGVYLW